MALILYSDKKGYRGQEWDNQHLRTQAHPQLLKYGRIEIADATPIDRELPSSETHLGLRG